MIPSGAVAMFVRSGARPRPLKRYLSQPTACSEDTKDVLIGHVDSPRSFYVQQVRAAHVGARNRATRSSIRSRFLKSRDTFVKIRKFSRSREKPKKCRVVQHADDWKISVGGPRPRSCRMMWQHWNNGYIAVAKLNDG